MRSPYRLLIAALLVSLVGAEGAQSADVNARCEQNWHQWRGPLGNGVAPAADPPVEWDAQTNIRWKAAIPGAGSATPIVWDDRVFVLSARETDVPSDLAAQPHPDAKTRPPANQFDYLVTCLDRSSGDVLWQRIAICEAPHEGHHTTNSYASASPVTDGERLYVSFGSRGLYCFDFEGNLVWSRDLGNMRTRFGWGEGASPALAGGLVVVNWDHEDESFITALDAATGEPRWRVARDEPTSWSTPAIAERGDGLQVVVNATNRVRGYDLHTGRILWECGGQTVNTIPSPVIANGVAYCASGYRGAALYAIPLDVTGDVSTDDVLWSHASATPYVPSPLVVGNRIYFTAQNTGVLTCLDAADGRVIFGPERLPGVGSMYASPIAASDRLYFVGRDGTTAVLQASDTFQPLATNTLEDAVDASPVAAGRQLFLRGASHVYCVEEAESSR